MFSTLVPVLKIISTKKVLQIIFVFKKKLDIILTIDLFLKNLQ